MDKSYSGINSFIYNRYFHPKNQNQVSFTALFAQNLLRLRSASDIVPRISLLSVLSFHLHLGVQGCPIYHP